MSYSSSSGRVMASSRSRSQRKWSLISPWARIEVLRPKRANSPPRVASRARIFLDHRALSGTAVDPPCGRPLPARRLRVAAPLPSWTFVGSGLLLLVVGLGAAWIPARMASSVDPARSLRGEG